MNRNEIPHLYVTNNSTKTPDQVVDKLREMKIDAKPEEIVTSALATADFISEEHPNASVYMLGGNGLKTALTEAGLTVKANEHVDYVVIGLDEEVTYEKLAVATLGVRNGAKFSLLILTSPFLRKEGSYLEMALLQVLLVFLLGYNHNLLVNLKR